MVAVLQSAHKYTILIVVLMICLTVVYVNFQHTSGCSAMGDEDVQMYIESLNKRLLKAESQNIQNRLLLDRFMDKVQSKIIRLEKLELKELSDVAVDEAVKVTLQLASQPLPAMPEYDLGTEYQNAEELADVIDDIFEKARDKKNTKGSVDIADYAYGYGAQEERHGGVGVSDAAASEKCTGWKKIYGIQVGVSWGSAPMDVQEKWIQLSCDYHLQSPGEGGPSARDYELSVEEAIAREEHYADFSEEELVPRNV